MKSKRETGENMLPNGHGTRLLFGVLLAGVVAGCSTSRQPALEALHQATVLVEHGKGHGSGMIIGEDAVLTAEHVLEDETLDVTFFKGEAGRGRVGWREPQLDLAIIEVAVPEAYQAPSLYCGELAAGQHLVSVGHPTHSRWVAVGGYLPQTQPFEGDLVALGFPIGLGTSGGPVFDAAGRVVGVALAILAERNSASANFGEFKDTGIGLMLPASAFCGDITTE